MATAGRKTGAAATERQSQGATARTMRLANRSLLLNLIREHAPVSRPSLALLSGMHRSNVAVIAGALIDEGLVHESSGQAQGRGRVPSMLSLADERAAVLGISVRPAITTGLLAKLDGSTEHLFSFPTPAAPQDFLARLRGHCSASAKANAKAIGFVRQVVLAVPGRMLPDAGLWMPDFPLYANFPLIQSVQVLLKKPVVLANGGNVAALAVMRTETTSAPISNLAFVAVHDEGVGGGIISEGRLYSGFDGSFAGEFGHIIVASDGPSCACGSTGCWGELISNRAVWAQLHPSRTFDLAMYRDFLNQVSSAKSDRAHDVLENTIVTLLRGIRNIAVTLNPQQIIVAGEITSAWALIEQHLARAPIFPNFTGKVHPASMSLSELYEVGTVQHGLAQIFRLGTRA